MKLPIRWLTAFSCLAFALPLQSAEPAADPSGTIRSFYRWYIGELSANRTPAQGRLQQFATTRLLAEIKEKSSGPDGPGADYFLDAQDFDNGWARNISVKDVSIRGEKATALVEFRGTDIARHSLKVWLVREAGSWKIDRVRGSE